jgi:hypothetical protein
MEKPSQVIQAEEVFSALSTFGFSVAGGMDLDENEYPDLVVGAYEADTAVYLRYFFEVIIVVVVVIIYLFYKLQMGFHPVAVALQ